MNDFNDLAVSAGLDAVRAAINAAGLETVPGAGSEGDVDADASVPVEFG